MFLQQRSPRVAPEDIMDALQNEHDRRILALVQERPLDAHEIIEATGIPKSTVYRRINQLEDAALLRVEEEGFRGGHVVDRYTSALDSLELRVVEGRVEARWHLEGDEHRHVVWSANGYPVSG